MACTGVNQQKALIHSLMWTYKEVCQKHLKSHCITCYFRQVVNQDGAEKWGSSIIFDIFLDLNFMGGAKCSQPKIQFPWQYQHIWAIKDIQMITPISLHPKPITLYMMPSTLLSQKDRLGLSKSRLVVRSLVLGGWQENNQVQLPLKFGWSLVMLPLWRRCDKWETESGVKH